MICGVPEYIFYESLLYASRTSTFPSRKPASNTWHMGAGRPRCDYELPLGTPSTGQLADAAGAVECTGDLNASLSANRPFGSRTGNDLHRKGGRGVHRRNVPPPPPHAAGWHVRPVSPNKPAIVSRPQRQHFGILVDEIVPPRRPAGPGGLCHHKQTRQE